MRALTSRSTRSLQAPRKNAASSTKRKRGLIAFMAIPSVLVIACSHRGCLDIHLAGIDDLVLVAGRALDRFALAFVDLAQLDLELLAERADLDRLGLGLIADAAHRSEEHTSELQSLAYLVCRLLLEKKKKTTDCSVMRQSLSYS